MDVAKLLEPHEDDGPSGENLEYDPEFVELELAAQPGEERQEGDTIIEAEEPDHGEVVRLAETILGRSHDIRAAVFYGTSVLHTKGLIGFAEATAYVRGCLETYWDTCHPELDEDDDNDPTMRINAVQGLSGADSVIRALRRTGLTDSRMFGKMSLRLMDVAEGTIPPPSDVTDVPDTSAIQAAFQDTDPEVISALLTAAKSANDDLAAIDAIFIDKTPGQGPDLEEAKRTLGVIIRRISDATGAEDAADEAGADEAAGADAGGGGGAGRPMGAINSSTDVINALDKIMSYYQRVEPSSPVPMLLERAKRLVGADFITIIKDIADQGKDQVYNIGGIEEEDTGMY